MVLIACALRSTSSLSTAILIVFFALFLRVGSWPRAVVLIFALASARSSSILPDAIDLSSVTASAFSCAILSSAVSARAFFAFSLSFASSLSAALPSSSTRVFLISAFFSTIFSLMILSVSSEMVLSTEVLKYSKTAESMRSYISLYEV